MATRAKARGRSAPRSTPAPAATDDAGTGADEAPPAVTDDSTRRAAALGAGAGKERDPGAADAREYFARCNRPSTAAASIEDVCGVLEYFGLTALPEGHATPHGLQSDEGEPE